MENQNFVSKLELDSSLKNTMSEMERKMEIGFANLEKSILELKHLMEIERKTDSEKYDDRYVLTKDLHHNIIMELSLTDTKSAIYTAVSEYMCSQSGKMKFEHLANEYLDKKRDDVSAWSKFIGKAGKIFIMIIIAIMLLYGGEIINKNNKIIENQQKQLNKINEILDNQQ